MTDRPTLKLTQEVTLTIGDPAVIAANPELHHYTPLAGLTGIVGSNTLRATHYRALNDGKEITQLKAPLARAVTARFQDILQSLQDAKPEIKRAIEQTGGLDASAATAAEGLVKSFYDVSFDQQDSFSFAEPYIGSFCAHPQGSYEQDNGLLSQWRGYARDGGYCIVFDTARLATLMGEEFDAHNYVHMNLLPAAYDDGSITVMNRFPTLIERFGTIFTDLITRRLDGPASMEDAFGPFVSGATSFKHQGFREECELRVVAIPSSKQVADRIREEHPDAPLKPIKPVLADERGRQHIRLFEGIGQPLPIKRIIVGPSMHQDENAENARRIVGDVVPIVRSDTPFIG
jgi:hypothetical protein